MLIRNANINRGQTELVNLEDMVPRDHLLRKIDAAVDFNRIYDFVEELYCSDNGRPAVDPVVLFKIVLIQHLYGINSLRRTVREINENNAYRWFLGYSLMDEIPHFSTVSYAFCHRFNEETAAQIFAWVLEEAANTGYLKPEAVFIDGTHIKANANIHKRVIEEVPVAAKAYADELMREVNEDRESNGKKPFKDNSDDDDDNPPDKPQKKRDNTSKKKLKQRKEVQKQLKTKEISVSTTDPECGVFHKGEHKKCFAYEAHTACDENNFVLDVKITPGNVHDSVAFDELYEDLTDKFPTIETVVADAGYKTPHICKKIFDDGRMFSTAYKRPMTKPEFFRKHEYVYDEYYNCYICPNNQILKYSTTNRDGYREYKSDVKICQQCPLRNQCTHSRICQKTVQRHIWENYVERAEDVRHTPDYRELYRLRKEKIERVFGDAKEKHGMRYTQYRGLARVSIWVRLKFAAMNLKKLASWQWNSPAHLLLTQNIYENNPLRLVT